MFPAQSSITLPPRDKPSRIFLFDVDGTLTVPRNEITPEMAAFIADLRTKAYIGIVGGSDLSKQTEQLGVQILSQWDYVFSENGLMAYKGGQLIAQQSFKHFMGEDRIKRVVNFCLRYIADLDIPVKRGTFIEFRNGMLNISPIGRNCTQAERDDFDVYNKEHKILPAFVAALKEEFKDIPLTYSIGGQISFDVFPNGWDKTFCLQFLKADGFDEIHFFGDKTYLGGNDHEIFEHSATVGHTVTSWEDTMRQVKEVLDADAAGAQ